MKNNGDVSHMKDDDLLCNRCGACCFFPDRRGKLHKCSFLQDDMKCSVYDHRIGVKGVLILNARCGYRKDSKVDYPNCPNNKVL